MHAGTRRYVGLLLVVTCTAFATPSLGAETKTAAAVQKTVEEQEAAIRENPLKAAYFGETHVHTSFSLDAYIGGARLTPDEAYKFAQGRDVVINGQKHNIKRPLDWAAVSDHAEFIGEMYSTQVPGAKGGENPMLEELRNLKSVDEQRAWFLKYVINNMRGANPGHPPFYAGPETTRSAWQEIELKATRDNYRPGTFTTLAGENGGFDTFFAARVEGPNPSEPVPEPASLLLLGSGLLFGLRRRRRS